jgi:hypothetical protein
MGLTRSLIVKGPAKLVYNSITYYTPDDISLQIDDGAVDVMSSFHGPAVDRLIINPKVTVSFTPHAVVSAGPAAVSRVNSMTALIPSIFTNGFYGTQYLGSGGSELTLQIWSSNGELVTINNAIITSPPSLTFSADKPIFGQCTITGICKTTSADINLGLANSLLDVAEAQADAGLAFLGVPSYLQRRYKGALGAQTGFTEIWPEGGWTVSFNPQWRERQIQGLTVDFELVGMEIVASCVPTGPTMSQIINLLGIGGDNGASWAQGSLQTAQQATHSRTIVDPSDSSVPVTLNKPVIRSPGFRFGHENLRNGELQFVSTKRFTAGVAGALAVFA